MSTPTPTPTSTPDPLDRARLCAELRRMGVREGSALIVHASLSAFGPVLGGADTVVGALLDCLSPAGTLVVPTFTPEVSDPHPRAAEPTSDKVAAARDGIPLFHDALPTSMGAVPTAVLAHPDRLRSSHPQASVAAVGPAARSVTGRQPLAYALGTGSPFEALHDLDADILLLGVGHNRNSFLHHAESRVPHHRRKLRRFPHLIDGQRVWVEARDVGDDNSTHFPRVGQEFAATDQVRTHTIGRAECRLMNSRALTRFATRLLGELLAP
ncbi:AAC(3) family N-acetyltransferase [Streptomyces sp. NPDC048491]|uniref:aminoglycoside N(3)-acetyltransferase n=1 Tax=Streptomyces sp. NPDC048491 TaxID=3157207 RepID=UPI003430AC44